MSQRYYVDAPIQGQEVCLSGDEAHHLARVMRASPGDEIVLFDGWGDEFFCRVLEASRNDVRLEIVERRRPNRELDSDLTLAVALPKGDRQRFLVEKLVELGAKRLVPLVTRRSVAQPTGNALERLRRAVIEASKQCGRNRLLEISAASSWEELLASQATMRLVAHPGGTLPLADALRGVSGPTSLVIAIGPEGGLDDDELAQAVAAGWQPVHLGPRILRVETAALAAAALAGALIG